FAGIGRVLVARAATVRTSPAPSSSTTATPPRTRRPSSRERRAPAFWRGGEVQLDRLAAGARARLDGQGSGAGLEDQRRGLLGAVDADPGAKHPAARAVATRLVRCQSEALVHHASTLAAARCAVNRKSELNELRAELAELRALIEARAARRKSNGHAMAEDAKVEVTANVACRHFRLLRARVCYGVLHNFGSAQVKARS